MEPKMDRLDENRSERQGWGLLSSGARHFLEPTCTRVRHWAPPDPEERQARGHPPPPRELCRKRPSHASHTRRQPAWAARGRAARGRAGTAPALQGGSARASANRRELRGGGCVDSALCCLEGERLAVAAKPEALRQREYRFP